eukprot:4977694-Karenia_brevis.AAC.1
MTSEGSKHALEAATGASPNAKEPRRDDCDASSDYDEEVPAWAQRLLSKMDKVGKKVDKISGR